MTGSKSPIWAVVPAAGLGTRMAENAVLGCKELVEVNGKTMLEHTIFELEKAGIEQIVVVSSPNKPAIDHALSGRGVIITHQSEPKGLVDAVECARSVIGGGVCLVALPDVIFTGVNPSATLLDEFEGDTLLTVVRVEGEWGAQLNDTGRITEIEDLRILGISDKYPERSFPQGQLRITGRAIWSEDFWAHNDGNEVTTLRKLALLQKLSASIVKTEYIDVGNPKGYQYAQLFFNR
ncbi:MAG: NTP transferase domain-containing protein [Candidatus Thermoplasmatota archaeon]|nr:NTP transferase domain-containing protein [Candidatus Thermoplasmatota archaeon]